MVSKFTGPILVVFARCTVLVRCVRMPMRVAAAVITVVVAIVVVVVVVAAVAVAVVAAAMLFCEEWVIRRMVNGIGGCWVRIVLVLHA